ncbi:hypothetical protein C0995_001715, partial [Termitomyces sp. Mi166
MVAAHAKARGDSKGDKGKPQGKGKGKEKHHCDNCKKDGHTKDQCFENGRGMAGKASDWWLKNYKGKGKDKVDKSKSVNTVKTKENDKNYAFLTFLTIDTPNDAISDNIALAVTSDHSHKAHAASPSAGIIID